MASSSDNEVSIGELLAGGSARRTGVDKRFLVLGGRALLVRNLAFLRGFFPTVAVSLGAGQMLDLGDARDAEVVHDAWPGASPLAGIASALARYRQPVFALAADIAFPDPEAIRRVLTAFPGHDLALPAIGPEYHQPLFAVYGPACLAPMTALLEADRHRIVEILLSLDVAEVRFPDDSLFHNINTMDDYEEARRQAAAGSDAPAADAQPALVAIVGKSDSGKTTLIEKVVPELVKLGLRVMLDGADAQAELHELWDDLLDQGRLARVALADDGDERRLGVGGRRVAACGRLAARFLVVVHGVDVMKERVIWKAHLGDVERQEDLDDAVAVRLEQRRHRRQAGGPVHSEQRLVVLRADGRQCEVVTGKGRQHAPDGLWVGKGDVGGQGEHGLPVARQGGGDARQRRRARPRVVHDLRVARVPEVEHLARAQ